MTSNSLEVSVVLVAQELPGEENLGVRYVAAALSAAGYPVRILRLNDWGELSAVGAAVQALQPTLVGLAMTDHQVAAVQLTLVAHLRAHGYRGRVVAGGAFATLVRHELLYQHEGLDAIVRREGEGPMVAVMRCLGEGGRLEAVPGVTTRSGDGPAYVESQVTPSSRPLRGELPTLLGMPSARIMASRGCSGHCAYCGSTSVRKDAAREARRAGLGILEIRDQNIAGQRLRPLADLADEIAELYHERRAKYFRLVDDHVLGPDAEQAERWLRTLSNELTARHVGRIALSMMLDPAVVNESVVDAMSDLGVVRVLVGVEALTAQGLRAIGRPEQLVESNRRVVTLLRDRGIAAFYNSIFLHPASTPQSIRAELEALPFVPGVPFDLLPLLVFPGTGLYERLERSGQLLGGLLGCDYRIANPVASLFRSLLHGIRQALPELFALSMQAADTCALDALASRFDIGKYSSARHALPRLIDKIGTLQIDVLRGALAIAEAEVERRDHVRACSDLVMATRPRILAQARELESVRQGLEGRRQRERPRLAPVAFGAVAAGLAALGPGCGGELSAPDQTETKGGSANLGGAVNQGGATAPSGGAASQGGATLVGNGGATSQAQGGSMQISTTVPDPFSPNCDSATIYAIRGRISEDVRPCGLYESCGHRFALRIDATGTVVDLVIVNGVNPEVAGDWTTTRDCAIKALSKERFPCLIDGFEWGFVDCRLI